MKPGEQLPLAQVLAKAGKEIPLIPKQDIDRMPVDHLEQLAKGNDASGADAQPPGHCCSDSGHECVIPP